MEIKVLISIRISILSLGIPTKAQVEIVTEGEDEKKAIEVIKDKINELGISTIE